MSFFSHENISGGILRRHRDAPGELGEPYLYSVTYDIDGDWAVIKGFYWRGISREEFEEIIRRINTETGKLVKYARVGDVLRTVYQLDPALFNGRIRMAVGKESIAHTDTAKSDAGVDQAAVVAATRHAADQIESGYYTITKLGQVDDASSHRDELEGALDALTDGETLLWFVRKDS